ncbi:GGDEF domain-containing protein [Actinotalea ferrariae]|uniref:GGDEF domain-containing protein n=1 Tax=Actinotalea ferrariae TaxID=1386098 RepID=UPI001C8BE350|nr:GGDEF domain-containing protein [Actinotalea ferrariae]MBX9243552.1 GGDEF domain-containing protein [Actinotalea ferrariae]
MGARGQGRLTRRDESRILALAYLIAGLVVGVTALVPFSPTAPRALAAVLAVVGVGLTAALRRGGDALRGWHLHAGLGLATALIGTCVGASTTPSGTVLTAVSFLWIGVFSATFHRRRVLLRHLAGVGAALAAGLWGAAAESAPQTWFFLMATIGCISLVLNGRIVDLRLEATTDELTGVLSRRAFRVAAELEMARAARTGQPLTLAVVDLDDFKRINDERGHAAGDAVLAGLARSWRRTLRADDVVGRFGGDEFILLLPHTDPPSATTVLGRLQADLCAWSAGVAAWRGQDFDEWFRAADHDLYRVKAAA